MKRIPEKAFEANRRYGIFRILLYPQEVSWKEKKQTRKEQALQTRSNILTVCTGLLREHTFDELSISMICREADISVGAFYHHFKTKSDIIVELYRDVDDVFVNDILPVCRQLPPLEAILQYLCEQCGYAETMGIDSIKNALSFAACGEGVLSENGYGYRKAFGGAADYEQGGNLLLVYPKRRNQCTGLYLSYGRGIFAGISCESVHFFVIIIQNRYTYDADSTKFTEK